MSFWERHRNALLLLASFLGAWFLLWLLALRGYGHDRRELEKTFEEKLEEEIETYCPPDAGRRVRDLRQDFEAANRTLRGTALAYEQALGFLFPEPLIPPKHAKRPQQFVRAEYRDLVDYVLLEAGTKRNIPIAPAARGLGFRIPAETTESPEQDREWLRQFLVIRRFVDLLLGVVEEPDETRNLVAIDRIEPHPPVATGPAPQFMTEYPVEVEFRITLRGLMRLLAHCSTPGSFHVVRSLEIVSDPALRSSEPRESREKTVGRRWTTHHYTVRMNVSTVVIREVDAEAEKADAPTGPSRPKLLTH